MKNLVLSLAILILTTSCAVLPGFGNSAHVISRSADLDTVVSDLMSVMNQLHDPRTTTIQYGPTRSGLGKKLLANVREQGYALQKVTQDQGANFLNFEEFFATSSADRKLHKFRVIVGGTMVERSYRKKALGGIYPASSIVIRGTDLPAEMNERLFSLRSSDIEAFGKIEYRNTNEASIRIPKVALITRQLVSEIASGSANLPNETGVNSSNLAINNVYFTNESNFAEITRGYRTIRRDLVVFGDDSLWLGSRGKTKIKKFLITFNESSDVISLLGCSNGPTGSPLGNEGLALGRAERVLEEFQSLGVPRSSLLDEGCWAPDSLAGKYPGRGVVVELKRRKP